MPDIHNHMNVVGHHHPRLEPISFSIVGSQEIFDRPGHRRPAQPAFTVTPIEPRFQLPAPNRMVRLPQDRLPLASALHRKGIIQHESDELRYVRRVKVRQVSPFVPAEKAAACSRQVRPVMPLPFCFNKFQELGIVWPTRRRLRVRLGHWVQIAPVHRGRKPERQQREAARRARSAAFRLQERAKTPATPEPIPTRPGVSRFCSLKAALRWRLGRFFALPR